MCKIVSSFTTDTALNDVGLLVHGFVCRPVRIKRLFFDKRLFLLHTHTHTHTHMYTTYEISINEVSTTDNVRI